MKDTRGDIIMRFHKAIEKSFQLAESCESYGLSKECDLLSQACESVMATFYLLDDLDTTILPDYLTSYLNGVYKLAKDRLNTAF